MCYINLSSVRVLNAQVTGKDNNSFWNQFTYCQRGNLMSYLQHMQSTVKRSVSPQLLYAWTEHMYKYVRRQHSYNPTTSLWWPPTGKLADVISAMSVWRLWHPSLTGASWHRGARSALIVATVTGLIACGACKKHDNPDVHVPNHTKIACTCSYSLIVAK